MRVKVIKKFKDLTIDRVRTLNDAPFDVKPERAKNLIEKGFVEPVIEAAIPKSKGKIEKAIKKCSRKNE